MTTEEKKKCFVCGFSDGTLLDNGEFIFHRECSPCTKAPPETGREWEEPNKPYGIRPAPGTCCPDMHKEIICRGCDHNHGSFDEAIASALAKGEKIGAEKERERLSKYTQHYSDCVRSQISGIRPLKNGDYEQKIDGVWYPSGKTPQCDCGLDDALKG